MRKLMSSNKKIKGAIRNYIRKKSNDDIFIEKKAFESFYCY